MKRLAVLVKDINGVGEVVGWYEEFWQALQAAQSLDGPYKIYVKSFSHESKEDKT